MEIVTTLKVLGQVQDRLKDMDPDSKVTLAVEASDSGAEKKTLGALLGKIGNDPDLHDLIDGQNSLELAYGRYLDRSIYPISHNFGPLIHLLS